MNRSTNLSNVVTTEYKAQNLLYANVKHEYNAIAISPLSWSKHSLVLLMPRYTSSVQQHLAFKITVLKWIPDAVNFLCGCLETKEWDAICDLHGVGIKGMPKYVMNYIYLCVKNIIFPRAVHCFPINRLIIHKIANCSKTTREALISLICQKIKAYICNVVFILVLTKMR